MEEGPPDVGQQDESSEITPDSLRAEITEFFQDPWHGSCIPFLKGKHLIQPYNDFIKGKENEFLQRLDETGNDPKKLYLVRYDLHLFDIEIESEWERIAKEAIRREEEFRDRVFEEFIENLPEPEKGDDSSGISAGVSVLPLGDPDPFRT